MNPLPNRPLLANPSIPLSLPNVPPFEAINYHRPRKVLTESGKDFPTSNGHSIISGQSSIQNPSGGTLLDRNSHITSGSNIQQTPGSALQPNPLPHPTSVGQSQGEKEKEVETDGRQLTAIFRPDDAGEWKEKLRLSHEVAEQTRLTQVSQTEDEEDGKEDESEVEDDESSVVGEGEDTKVWRAKRTLRKLVV